jgi:hypothetical protein
MLRQSFADRQPTLPIHASKIKRLVGTLALQWRFDTGHRPNRGLPRCHDRSYLGIAIPLTKPKPICQPAQATLVTGPNNIDGHWKQAGRAGTHQIELVAEDHNLVVLRQLLQKLGGTRPLERAPPALPLHTDKRQSAFRSTAALLHSLSRTSRRCTTK